MDGRESRQAEGVRRVRTLRRIGSLVLLLVALALGWTFRGPIGFANFGVVDEGRAYRCAQPGSDLESTARALNLRSILNLRGGTQNDEFYRTEVRISDRLHLDFYDLPISATRRPSRTDLLRLLDVLNQCRYPLLIHCKSGADRTGLAACLYRLQVQGVSPAEAEGGFSLAYGHIPFFGPQRLHEPITEYRDWLDQHHLTHSPARFRSWVTWEYRDDDAVGELDRPTRAGPRGRLAKSRKQVSG